MPTTAPEPEQWAPILEAPGYDVSTWGRVRRGEYLVATWPNKKGYYLANLEIAGEPTLRYVHRLVLAAFRGAPTAGLEANHRSGDKADNSIANLEWTTGARNRAHARRIGLVPAAGDSCQHGHPRDQIYRQRDARGRLHTWRRCARCRRVLARARRDRRAGFRSLLELLEE
jgi:hypothetical protein